MIKILVPLLFLFASSEGLSAVPFKVPNDQMNLGKGVAGDKTIVFEKGSGSSNPKVKYDNAASKVKVCHDGTTCKTINLGSDIDSGAATANQVLTADGSGNSSFQDSQAAPKSSHEVSNLGLSTSIGSNLLTVSLKQQDGSSDPTALAPVKIGFRESTLTSGAFLQRLVTGALSINTVAVGASFGTLSGVNQYVYVYAIDNAGTVELALAGSTDFDEGTRYSTTAIGASSTSATVLYSTTARSNVAIRLIGRVGVNEATAGTYATAPFEISLHPILKFEPKREVTSGGSRQVLEWATYNSSGILQTQSGNWVASTSHPGTGVNTITPTTGTWSATPTCVCSATASNDSACGLSNVSTTSISTSTRNVSTGTLANLAFNIFCVGPR